MPTVRACPPAAAAGGGWRMEKWQTERERERERERQRKREKGWKSGHTESHLSLLSHCWRQSRQTLRDQRDGGYQALFREETRFVIFKAEHRQGSPSLLLEETSRLVWWDARRFGHFIFHQLIRLYGHISQRYPASLYTLSPYLTLSRSHTIHFRHVFLFIVSKRAPRNSWGTRICFPQSWIVREVVVTISQCLLDGTWREDKITFCLFRVQRYVYCFLRELSRYRIFCFLK